MNFVADTHALLWWFTDSPRMGSRASEIFEKCEKGENVIFIPSIVIAESLSIFDKKRISFNFKNLLKKVHTYNHQGQNPSEAAFHKNHLVSQLPHLAQACL